MVPKKTDKKVIKYRVLQGLSDFFKNIARRKENSGRKCKLVLRIQDSSLNKKAELLRNISLLQQLKSYREFELCNEKAEKELDDFLVQIKQIDTIKSKTITNYNTSKVHFF